MCYESECCGGSSSYRYRKFVIGFWFGLAILAVITVAVVLAVGYGRVSRLKVAVDDDALTRFTATATAVAYNLTVSLVVVNPNWAMAVTYRSLAAAYLFDGKRFDVVAAVVSSGYKQPARRTAVFRLTSGSDAAPVSLGKDGEREYRKEADDGGGVFDVEVDISGEVKYQLHNTWCRLEARCSLKLQLPPPPHPAPPPRLRRRRRRQSRVPEDHLRCAPVVDEWMLDDSICDDVSSLLSLATCLC